MMAEFKVNPSLKGEITSFNNAGNEINTDIVSVTTSGVSSLKTSVKFVEEHKSIKQLLNLYQKLITNEVKDLNAMMKSAQDLDEDIAKRVK